MPSPRCANSKDCTPRHQTMTMVSPSRLRDLFLGQPKWSNRTCVSVTDSPKHEEPGQLRVYKIKNSRRPGVCRYRRLFMANRTAVLQTNKGMIRFELLETDTPKTT